MHRTRCPVSAVCWTWWIRWCTRRRSRTCGSVREGTRNLSTNYLALFCRVGTVYQRDGGHCPPYKTCRYLMPQTHTNTLTLTTNQEEAILLFGPRDQYLKLIRDALG